MASKSQIIDKLNELRSTEQRMALVYRRAAQMCTGPYREVLAKEFSEHAEDEDDHADTAMRRIMALGGDITADISAIPLWRNLDDLLRDLDELEEQGIRKWQELDRMLSKDDPFKHVISSILDREVGHSDDVKQWLRRDFAEKSMGDHGAPKPLNWREPQFHNQAKKSVSWQEQLQTHSQHGTPLTRRGAFNGQAPSLQPSMPAAMNPPLTLDVSKAVRTPQKPGASGAQFQRKRGADGKFVEQQQAGVESTAAQDVDEQKRQAELQTAKQRDKQRKPFQEAKAGKEGARRAGQLKFSKAAPGFMSTADADQTGANGMEQGEVMSQLPDGTPIYSDPFHPSHQNFSADQHQEAANVHSGMAQSSAAAGSVEEEEQHLRHAAAHEAMMNDAQSPMDRAMGNLAGAPGQGQQPPMDQENPAMKMQQAFKALNYSYSPDDLDQFTQQQPDMNKPSFGQRSEGPAPGMQHTTTGGPVGPQTDAMNAGAPPPMGGTPDAGQAPMDISAQGQQPNMDAGAVPPMPPPMDQGMAPPPPMDQGMAPPPMDQGMAPPPPMDQGMGQPPMDQGMAPPPPMDQGMGQPPMGQGAETGNPPVGMAPPPPMDQGMGQPGEDPYEDAPHVYDSFGGGISLDDTEGLMSAASGFPELSEEDKHAFYGGDASAAEPTMGDEETPDMSMGGEGGPPPEMGSPSPTEDFGGGEEEGQTSASAPPNPFGGNDVEDKADKESAPQGANDQSNPFGQPRAADAESSTEGPSNEPKDEKKTYGLDALKSWSARH